MNNLALPTPHGAIAPLGQNLTAHLPSWLRGRRVLMLGVFALVGAGLALGWPWLVAFGLAPLVLSLLPCAAMCALGLCMMGGKDAKSCHSQADASVPEIRPAQ